MPLAEEAIVLVGGLGTRLRSEVGALPKPLAPVAGRPFLAYLLDRLVQAGMRRAILATGYGSAQVEAAIGREWNGMAVDYSVEDAPLGTGGAAVHAARLLHGAQAHLMNGDTFLRFDLAALERSVRDSGAAMGMALARVPDVSRYGAVEVADGRVRSFREKGGEGAGLINAGSYFLTEQAFAACPAIAAFSFEEAVLHPLAAAGRVAAYADTSDFIDIGVPEDFRLAQTRFAASA
jgi:D-glycero-alpha-D-manno-heptose 1-phosphate guanylyltransferase